MINISYTNIFKQKECILIHGCNCQGRFNSGFAKYVRRIHPKAYLDYLAYCENNTDLLGKTCITQITDTLYIHNAFTQEFYGRETGTRYVSYKAIELCFKTASDYAMLHDLPLVFPKIGAGLGGGNWVDISKIIEETVDPSITKTLFLKE